LITINSVEHWPQSQKNSTRRLGFLSPPAELSTVVSISNSLPSRKYRNGWEQAGLAHFDNMFASGLQLPILTLGKAKGSAIPLAVELFF
jgi:hypothetical protein